MVEDGIAYGQTVTAVHHENTNQKQAKALQSKSQSGLVQAIDE
jgi:hypothetical protein